MSLDGVPLFEARPLAVPASLLGESPFWHPTEAALYWCDIPGKSLHRFQPSDGAHRAWTFDCEPCSMAPMLDGQLLLAMRDGLWRFDPASGQRHRLVAPPYDPANERFNDGKADPQGRFWVGTIYEPREPALAALYRWSGGQLVRIAGDVTVSNGLAWSPDGRRMYWSDTKTHRIDVLDADAADGSVSNRRLFKQFPLKQAGQALEAYGGRPDGAAMDSEGCYWSALFEGQRLLRLSPEGDVLREVHLPVRCATMACFGDADLKTLYITTAREKRPADELAAQPWAGLVLRMRVDVPGLPVNFVLG
jgi:sugar lactone lactonase YvrE